MDNKKKSILRIDINYTFAQIFYWTSYCCIGSFSTIYLTYRGLNNTQIGLVTSFNCILAIVLQLIISSFSDKHMQFPIKWIIILLSTVAMGAAAMLFWLPLATPVVIAAFAITYAFSQSNNGYLNAQLIQFNNTGTDAHYGLPRGLGSAAFAVLAFCLGKIVAQYSARILMPIFLTLAALFILADCCMPNPYKTANLTGAKNRNYPNSKHTSYREMLQKNPALIILLCCSIISASGTSSALTFMPRVVEHLGGGTTEYGISELIRAGMELPMLAASGFFLKRFDAKNLVTVSFFCHCLRIFLYAIAPSLPFLYLASAMNVFCTGFYAFATVVYVNRIVLPTEKVRAQSLMALCLSLGSIIGNAYSGIMLDTVGVTVTLLFSSSLCAVAGLGLAFLAPEKRKAAMLCK